MCDYQAADLAQLVSEISSARSALQAGLGVCGDSGVWYEGFASFKRLKGNNYGEY